MITLGIDPSLNGFGWCVHDSRVVGAGRVLGRGVFKKSEGSFVARYMLLRSQLLSVLEEYPQIEAAGVESPVYGEQWSSGAYALFVYVNEALYLTRKDVVYLDPITVKMMAKMDPKVRQGTMDKTDMIEAAKAETSIKVWDHNEADAYVIARSAASFWEYEKGILKDADLIPSEIQAFNRVHQFKKGEKAGQVERRGLLFREDDRFFRFSAVPSNPEDQELSKWLQKRTADPKRTSRRKKSPK